MHRPEDRHGIRQGKLLSEINVGVYRAYSRPWRRLPSFRGKVRTAKELRRLLGLENHHILESVTLNRPVSYKATLDLHSWLEFIAYFTGGYEADTVEFLVKCYNNNGYFLDVGANIGLISVPFSIMTRSTSTRTAASVYSIEAVNSNHERLQENIEINGLLEQISAINCGVAECEKTVEIQVEGNLRDGEGTGTANILADNTDHPAERISLDVTTIDKLINTGVLADQCCLMKIDLDGYDLKALQGANSLLSLSRPVIFGEFSAHCLKWHGQTHQHVENHIRAFDYEVFYRNKDSWHFSRSCKQDGDLLILPMERLSDFTWCIESAS